VLAVEAAAAIGRVRSRAARRLQLCGHGGACCSGAGAAHSSGGEEALREARRRGRRGRARSGSAVTAMHESFFINCGNWRGTYRNR
jgi:hypothetical protein